MLIAHDIWLILLHFIKDHADIYTQGIFLVYIVGNAGLAAYVAVCLPIYCGYTISTMLLFVYSSIAVWAVVKKKPLVRRLHNSAEGGEEGGGEEEGVGSGWVTAVAAFPNTDLVASGQDNARW